MLLMTRSVYAIVYSESTSLSLFLQFGLGRRLEHIVLSPSYSQIVLFYTMDFWHFVIHLSYIF